MAHGIETIDGQSAFVSARESAWHSLGLTLPESFTAEEAMEHGLLGGWNIRKVPAYAHVDGMQIEIKGRKTVVRDNPVRPGQIDVLGSSVGDNYVIVQNEEHAEFLNALVDESGAHFETAGSLHNGSQVFLTMKLPGHMLIGGVDQHDTYIAAMNDHSGNMAFTLMTTAVRVVCQNTWNMAMDGATNVYRIPHRANAKRNLASQAREALDLSFNYLDSFNEQAHRLIDTTMTSAQFESIIRAEYGPGEDPTKHALTRSETKIQQIQELFDESDTHADVRNTAWAGLNAITEWHDHFSPVRGDDRDQSRAMKALFNPGFKTDALNLMLAQAS